MKYWTTSWAPRNMHLKVKLIVILHFETRCLYPCCIYHGLLHTIIAAWTGPVRRQHHVVKVRADANTTGCRCTTDVFHVDSGPILAVLKWGSTSSLVDHQIVRFCKIEVHLHETLPGRVFHHTCLALLMVEILHQLLHSLQNNLCVHGFVHPSIVQDFNHKHYCIASHSSYRYRV